MANKNYLPVIIVVAVCALFITAAFMFWVERSRFMQNTTAKDETKESFEDDPKEDCEGNCRDYTLGYKPFDIRCRALDPVFNYWLFPNIMDTGCGTRPEPSCGTPCPTDCPDPASVYGRPLPVPSDIPDPF